MVIVKFFSFVWLFKVGVVVFILGVVLLLFGVIGVFYFWKGSDNYVSLEGGVCGVDLSWVV